MVRTSPTWNDRRKLTHDPNLAGDRGDIVGSPGILAEVRRRVSSESATLTSLIRSIVAVSTGEVRMKVLFGTIAVLAVTASLAGAQQPPKIQVGTMARTSPSDAQEMFTSYCAACHGSEGKGNGPADVTWL